MSWERKGKHSKRVIREGLTDQAHFPQVFHTNVFQVHIIKHQISLYHYIPLLLRISFMYCAECENLNIHDSDTTMSLLT